MAVNGVCMTFLIGVTKSDFREGFSGSDCGGRSSLAGVAGAIGCLLTCGSQSRQRTVLVPTWFPLFLLPFICFLFLCLGPHQ